MNYKAIQNIKYLIKSQSNLYIHSPFVFDFYNFVLKNLKDKSYANESILPHNGDNKDKIIHEQTQFHSLNQTFISQKEFISPYTSDIIHLLSLLQNYYKLPNFYIFNQLIDKFIYITFENTSNNNLISKITDGLPIEQLNFPFPSSSIQGALLSLLNEENKVLHLLETLIKRSAETSVFICTDLYESETTTKLWHHLQEHPKITLSLDLFEFGIVFFTPLLKKKQHFILRY